MSRQIEIDRSKCFCNSAGVGGGARVEHVTFSGCVHRLPAGGQPHRVGSRQHLRTGAMPSSPGGGVAQVPHEAIHAGARGQVRGGVNPDIGDRPRTRRGAAGCGLLE